MRFGKFMNILESRINEFDAFHFEKLFSSSFNRVRNEAPYLAPDLLL